MAKKLPFEKIFPYFSYRWRYEDGEYSPYAPFSKVAFFPKDPDVEDFFKKGHNTSMANNLENITLNNIGRGGPDVVAVDILYTESLSSTVYILKTIELAEGERGISEFLDPVVISERSFETALPNDQLNRHFDNVPLKAKAQEVTANRLMYGNYTHKFDQNNDLRITLGTTTIAEPLNGPSIKSNRTYDVGVAFIDKFGRVGNIITQKTKDITTEGSSIKTDFSLTFRTLLTATIDKEKFAAPDWAKYYRYYVKDVSGEHFNLSGFNIYNDGNESDNNSDNVYIQFPSSDRNKITEESILIPKRHNFDGVDSIFTTESRHPVLDIENEAPDIVKNQVLERTVHTISGATFFEGTTRIISPTTVHGQSSISSYTTQVNDLTIVLEDEGNDGISNFQRIASSLNAYILSQDSSAPVTLEQTHGDSTSPELVINVSGFGERLAMRINPTLAGNNASYQTEHVLVDEIRWMRVNNREHRNAFKFTLSKRINEDGAVTTGTGLSKGGVSGGVDMQGASVDSNISFYKLGISADGKEKLKGTFFVKVPRETTDSVITTLPTGQTEYNTDGKVESSNIKEINFETEPIADSNLNLYWESSKTFTIDEDYGQTNTIEFANCIATALPATSQQHGKIYLESTKLFDKFNTVEVAKGIRVITPETRYAQETRKSGIIFSGLFNSKTGINELNQFNMSLNPTKELEPNYGGIQKLYTLDTNLLALTEDKVFRVLADKDALFNADDGVNVTATNLVLGQAMSYQGDFGISTHPESFAFFNNNAYFTDAKRGVVLQLSPANGQIFPISSIGMSNFFRDRLGALNAGAKLIGAHNGYKKQYLISIQGYNQNAASIGSETIPNETSEITLAYSQRAKGWTSRFSFIPEFGITSNSKFYTFKNGKVYLHNSNTAARNNFYGVQYNSEVQVIFNDNPTFVSDWLSINYEGSEGWEAIEIIGDQDSQFGITNVRILDSEEAGFLGWFLKEGKYRGAIVGTQPVYIIDPGGSVGSDGLWPLIQDGANTQDISGTKGFFQKTRFRNSGLTTKELFAVSSEYYISQT
jgi:hypothetical protein